ncbi:MAG: 6-bladed beta-propeller, partial [Gemmatimonadales bacterium]
MRFVALLVVPAFVGACGGSEAATPTTTVRDSAGVTIVENRGDGTVWADRHPWVVPDEPVLRIGEMEGEEPYQLFRVSDVLRLPDGRVVVANGGSGELRFFDADGRYLMSAGRKGSGPGEFESLGPIVLVGDSIAAYDWRLRRISVFDTSGAFGRSYDLRFPSGSPRPVGAFADGRWLAATNMVFRPAQMSGVRRDTAAYFVFSAEGTEYDSLFTFPSWEFYLEGDDQFVVARSLPFSRGPHQAVFADGFWAGVTDRYEIGRYAPDGTLELLLRREHTHLPVTDAHLAAYREDVLESLDSDNQ